MRIALLSLHTSPLAQPGQGDAGGMNVYVRSVAEEIAASGHQVDVYTRDDGSVDAGWDSPQEPTLHKLSVGPAEPISKDEIADLVDEFAAELAQAFAAGNYDAVHTHYWISGIAGLEALQRLSSTTDKTLPLVHTMHTIAAVKNSSYAQNLEHPARQEAEMQLCAKAEALVVNTAAEAAELVHYYDADPQRIEVIAPGVNLERFSPTGPKRRWGEAEELKILFAGRLQPLKGPDILVSALECWQEKRATPLPVKVLITGAISGNHSMDLPAQVRAAGLEDLVEFIGPLVHEELAAAYRGADVVVMPSHSESFGLVALEAQACGTPVLAHRVGGLTAAVADGISGELLPNLDPRTWAAALHRWALHPNLVAQYAQAARPHAEAFSWERTAATSVQLYRDLGSSQNA
ncbi:glycosyltransferase [Micrococcoides hystricis]|uniref:D-inositol 3-phosphate glycosyltransferase n=1 Tax=Micrococcoides hystricis TaxID=1572761 RepID=A0ABV6P789_9MICC